MCFNVGRSMCWSLSVIGWSSSSRWLQAARQIVHLATSWVLTRPYLVRAARVLRFCPSPYQSWGTMTMFAGTLGACVVWEKTDNISRTLSAYVKHKTTQSGDFALTARGVTFSFQAIINDQIPISRDWFSNRISQLYNPKYSHSAGNTNTDFDKVRRQGIISVHTKLQQDVVENL